MSQSFWDRVANQRLSRRRALAVVAASGASAAILAACSSDDGNDGSSEPDSGSTSAEKPVPGGRYGTYALQSSNYSPVVNYHEGYNGSGITAYDRPITARGDSKEYTLEAAAKIEVASPTRIVMTLKPDMVYHNKAPVNGRKVLASDVVASQNYIKELSNAYDAQFQRALLDRMEAPNDTTIVFHLKQPSAYLFSTAYLANPTSQLIIPAEMLDKVDTSPPVGSGPYELVDHTFGQRSLYKKFDNFREAKNGMPYISDRETFVIVDPVAQEAALRSGQISEYTPTTAQLDRLLSELDSSKFANAIYLNPSSATGATAMMNASLGGPRPWHDIRVREAMYRVINKQQWVELGYRGRAVINTGPLPKALERWEIDPKIAEPYYKEDLQRANQLLDAANYDRGKEWEIITPSQPTAVFSEIWSTQLARAGIKTRVAVVPLAEMLPKRMTPAQFDLQAGFIPSGETPSRGLRYNHSNTNQQFTNIGLYNKEVDALIEKSEIEINRDENVKLVKEVQKMLLDQYTTSNNPVTDQRAIFYDARLKDFFIDTLVGQDYQYQAWMKMA